MINGIEALESLGFDHIKATRLSGGDINEVFKIDGKIIKINRASDFPDMLAIEGNSLELLGQHFRTPKVLQTGSNSDFQFLEMEYIPSGNKTSEFWQKFGQSLAILHLQSSRSFGLDFDNYIGSLRQSNSQKQSWEEFLVLERLQPMVEMAVNNGDVNYVEAKVFDNFYLKINELLPKENPAFVHGDLWGGNYLCSSEGEPVLLDPAIYYGHREMDIAMMHLFGGFESKLFDHYNEEFPLEKGWRNRIELNQLYPLMVHVNLFGRSYWTRVYNILRQFA